MWPRPGLNGELMAKLLMISALASGQGKTTVTAALARKLRNAGQRVRVFKSGPDFIDPAMLETASGSPVLSLDLWMTGQPHSHNLLAEASRNADVVLLEGVMGLYDGQPSSADLASAFDIPVLLALDVAAMAQTAGAVAQGLRDYGPVRMAGVIANRVASDGHAQMIAEAMRDIPLLGTLKRQADSLPERHLGLVLPQEVPALNELLDQLAEALVLNQSFWDALPDRQLDLLPETQPGPLLQGKTIAVARDAAFAFIYPANLSCLRQMGAQLRFFSPLANQAIPAEADALYLPGGYPELHAPTLAAAERWQASIQAACTAGMPVWAECGGMMALVEQLVGMDGQSTAMAAILPGTVSMQKRLAALGPHYWQTAAGELRGHSFHFSRFDTCLPAYAQTCKQRDGASGEAVYRHGSVLASYFHAYFPSSPAAVAAIFNGALA